MTRSFALLIVALVALVMAANGLAMLFAGPWWYGIVPGVTETGPFNPHFVKDIGAAYLVAGVGLGWWAAARSGVARGAAMAGVAFLGLHALIHLAEAAAMPAMAGAHLARDFAGVFLPPILAALALWLARPPSETHHA